MYIFYASLYKVFSACSKLVFFFLPPLFLCFVKIWSDYCTRQGFVYSLKSSQADVSSGRPVKGSRSVWHIGLVLLCGLWVFVSPSLFVYLFLYSSVCSLFRELVTMSFILLSATVSLWGGSHHMAMCKKWHDLLGRLDGPIGSFSPLEMKCVFLILVYVCLQISVEE